MLIEKIFLESFSLPLRRPFYVRPENEPITSREGIIVRIMTDRGITAVGEAAPLPGFSAEPLKKTRHQLDVLIKEWQGRSIDPEDDLIRLFSRSFDANVCSSARFGLESAVLAAVARTRKLAPWQIIRGADAQWPPLFQTAGLLQGSLQEVVDQARILKARGYRTFKLKVGNRNIALDVQKVERLKTALGPEVVFRLDANRVWRYDEALLFGQSIGKNQIEFIEEPCVHLDKWEELHRRIDIPLAVDESQDGSHAEDLADRKGLDVFVVKPTVRGGVSGTIDLIRKSDSLGRKVIISSSFESTVGLTMLANLAVVSRQAPGLGSTEWFAPELTRKPVVLPDGRIDPAALT